MPKLRLDHDLLNCTFPGDLLTLSDLDLSQFYSPGGQGKDARSHAVTWNVSEKRLIIINVERKVRKNLASTCTDALISLTRPHKASE